MHCTSQWTPRWYPALPADLQALQLLWTSGTDHIASKHFRLPILYYSSNPRALHEALSGLRSPFAWAPCSGPPKSPRTEEHYVSILA